MIVLKPDILKKIDNQIKTKNIPLTLFLLLFFSGIYYGGLYQNQNSFLIGYFLFFLILFYVIGSFLAQKKISLQIILIGYIVIALWTIIFSPHPIVDTFVVLKEAPLKFLSGINPYTTLYSKVYPHINPNYYNYLPVSFIFLSPFVFFLSDPRFAIIFVNVVSAIILYKLFYKKNNNLVILFIYTFLFLPRSFYILEHVYLDPVIFFFFVLFYYFSTKKQYIKLSFLFLSLFFSIKQPPILLIPLFIKKLVKPFRIKGFFIFALPFIFPLYYLLINKKAFINNVILSLSSGTITSPISNSLTLLTFIKSIIPVSFNVVLFILTLIFFAFYVFTIKSKVSIILKVVIIMFCFNFFSYHAFFNSYYFVLQFLLLEIAIDYFDLNKLEI